MFKKIFSERNTYWGGAKKLGGTAPECPRDYRPEKERRFPNEAIPILKFLT